MNWSIAILIIVIILLLGAATVRQIHIRDDIKSIPSLDILRFEGSGPRVGIVASIHGNEPAGVVTVSEMIARDWFLGRNYTVIRANLRGFMHGTRVEPMHGLDLNRQFNVSGCSETSLILNALRDCDIIIDLHEGWGWYAQTRGQITESVGSTLAPTSAFDAMLPTAADNIVDKINVTMSLPVDKRFMVRRSERARFEGSLATYCEKENRPYLLVETSGQNDIQPMKTRASEMFIIIDEIDRAIRDVNFDGRSPVSYGL